MWSSHLKTGGRVSEGGIKVTLERGTEVLKEITECGKEATCGDGGKEQS